MRLSRVFIALLIVFALFPMFLPPLSFAQGSAPKLSFLSRLRVCLGSWSRIAGPKEPAPIESLNDLLNVDRKKWDIGVQESEIQKSESLGAGGSSTAWRGEFQGQNLVYVKLRALDPEDVKKGLLSQLSSRDLKKLSEIRFREAKYFSERDLSDQAELLAGRKFKPIERAQQAVGRVIMDVNYVQALAGLEFEGRPIAPKVLSVVRNRDGLITGYLTEFVQGTSLLKLAQEGGLTVLQLKEVGRQVEGQLLALRNFHGAFHGDPNLSNILVELDSNQKPIAHLIDFYPRTLSRLQEHVLVKNNFKKALGLIRIANRARRK